MKNQFTYTLLTPNDPLPAQENISAVFLVAFQQGKILAARNERTWDVPGGHLEEGENTLAALKREVLEEAGAEIQNAIPFALLASRTSKKVMVFYTSNTIKVVEFVPSEDAIERDLMEPKELLRRYNGDKKLLQSLIESAKIRLGLS